MANIAWALARMAFATLAVHIRSELLWSRCLDVMNFGSLWGYLTLGLQILEACWLVTYCTFNLGLLNNFTCVASETSLLAHVLGRIFTTQ